MTNLSLGFKVGKFRDSGPLEYDYGLGFFHILVSNKLTNLSSGFRVGKFRDNGPLDFDYGFYFSIFFISNKTKNLSLGFRVGKFLAIVASSKLCMVLFC